MTGSLPVEERTSRSRRNLPVTTQATEYCDDDRYTNFFVKETGQEEPCVWLHARMDEFACLCEDSHPSFVREICRETCGVCSDDCDDTDGTFTYDGIQRDCLWLSIRNWIIDEPGISDTSSEASIVCPERCDTCDGARPAPKTTDVLIAGAGFSGMAAGEVLANQGLNFTIAEASDRIGGRAWCREMGVADNSFNVNTGCNWVSGEVGSPVCDLQIRTNLTGLYQAFYPFRFYDGNGTLHPEENDYATGTAAQVSDHILAYALDYSLNCFQAEDGELLDNYTQYLCDT